MDNFGLCLIITQPILSYEEIAKVAVECDIKYLQLREKDMSDKAILEAARRIKSVTDGTCVQFVMNDRADLALLAGADILHIGQDDISTADARKIVGADMPIGLSTHSISHAKAALALPNDCRPAYIGFGPIYATTTKANADPTVGTELLSEVLSFADVPVIAIGGIFPSNIATVTGAGAKNLCLVRHFMECTTTAELKLRIREIQSTL